MLVIKYTASSDLMMVSNEFKNYMQGVAVRFKVLYQYFPGDTGKKTTKISVRIFGVLAKIRTGYLS
jgi:hypothetical protein